MDRNIIVVLSDSSKFRGKLIRFDSKTLVLEDLYELSDRFQWVRPIIYTTVTGSMTGQPDVIEQTDRGYLNEAIVNTRHIIRIWPWVPKKIEK